MDPAVTLAASDIVALVLYFVIVFAIGFWASCRADTSDTKGYFLAGQSTHWIVVGASTFATNVGAPMFIGLAGSAASKGLVPVMFEWQAMLMLIALGWFFLPVYRASGCLTMPQFLQLRYGGQRIRVFLAIVHTFNTIIASLAGQMYAGALFIQQIFQWNLYLSVVLILGVTACYTIIGGLTAVLWTDTIQTVILIIGSIVLAIISLTKVGGFETMRNMYDVSSSNETFLGQALYGNHSCGEPEEKTWNIFRPADAGDYPWPGMVFGLTILAANYWCNDQICVQRSLSAKSVSHAKAGVLLAAYLKITPFIFFIVPGMISRVFYPDEIGCSTPSMCEAMCDIPGGCTNVAYPLLVIRILPDGLRGLMLAGLLAALMSSLTSIFNSSSTVFTIDLWGRFRPKADEKELMLVGRLYTLVLVGITVLWLPILQAVQESRFLDYAQSIYSHILPPIVTAFFLGVIWPRATEKGAFSALVIGVSIGLVRLVLSWVRSGPDCGSGDPDNTWPIISNVHYMHFAIILLLVSVFIVVSVSLMTEPRSPGKLRRVTFWTKDDPEPQELSEDEDEEEEEKKKKLEEKEDEESQSEKDTSASGRFVTFFKVYVCGMEQKRKKPITPAEMIEIQKNATNIQEDPTMKKILDYNAVLCAAVCVFLHAFWA